MKQNINNFNIYNKKLNSKTLNSIYICYYYRDIKAVLVKYKLPCTDSRCQFVLKTAYKE